jgi:hypothetical protein
MKAIANGNDINGEFNFEILDSVKPSINGKNTYQRLLIRRLPATGEKVLSICAICESWMKENGMEKDLNECDKCELECVIMEEE